MAAPQNFRSAFNGFNREDVVHYLEYINAKHTAEINQLTAEADSLRSQLELQPAGDQQELINELTAKLEDSEQARAELESRCAELEAQLAAVPQSAAAEEVQEEAPAELEVYRRAERAERLAKERAELVYHQANGVLAEATAKVDATAADITAMADEVMSRLTQLQVAVGNSKVALQDAASIMNTIRPNLK